MKKFLKTFCCHFSENHRNLPTFLRTLSHFAILKAVIGGAGGFTSGQKSANFRPVLAKSNTEPENSNNLQMANSTPPACFFIRSIRTPKENASSVLLSMVAFGGKGFALCCVPFVAVSQPVKRYRQSLRRKAVALENSQMELSAMIYYFLGISRQTYDKSRPERLKVQANNRTEARAKLARDYVLIPIGQLNETSPIALSLATQGGENA